MSMQPRPCSEVPEQTVAVARAAFPEETLAMRVRDELPGLFADEHTVPQFADDRTDRRAADAVRARIDWQFSLGPDLSCPGFDHTGMTGFQQRLIDHELAGKVPDLLLARPSELGLVNAKGQRAGHLPTKRDQHDLVGMHRRGTGNRSGSASRSRQVKRVRSAHRTHDRPAGVGS
ncbi:hypothetical protein ACWDKQ_24295 [Saccharopolyspora sp. NPDC000995]